MERQQKVLTVTVENKDQLHLEFVRLFTDIFVNSSSDCCKILQKIFGQSQMTFSELCEVLSQVQQQHKKTLSVPSYSDTTYTFRFSSERNHVILALDVSSYMYHYDYSTKSLAIQNLQDIVLVLLKLLSMKNCQGIDISVYGFSTSQTEPYVVFEYQPLDLSNINQMFNQILFWLRKRYVKKIEQMTTGIGIGQHVQKILDRMRFTEKMSHRMAVISSFRDLPHEPTILFPNGWCTIGFIATGEGRYGVETVNAERIREQYPCGKVFKTRHFYTARFFSSSEKEKILRENTNLQLFSITNHKQRNVLFENKSKLIENIMEKLMYFELRVELRKVTDRHNSYNIRQPLRQYEVPAVNIIKILKSRYMEGWQPFHSGNLTLGSKTYCFKLQMDRLTHLIYCATLVQTTYIVRIFLQNNISTSRHKKIIEQSLYSNIIIKEVEQLEQIDKVLTSDYGFLRSKFKPAVSISTLLDHRQSSELDTLINTRFRQLWNIFFPVRRIIVGTLRCTSKTESQFLNGISDLIGKRMSFRFYSREIDDGQPNKKKSKRSFILTMFIKHNVNCLEILTGFANVQLAEIEKHQQEMRNRLGKMDLGTALVFVAPEILLSNDTISNPNHKFQWSYEIKTQSDVLAHWYYKHIIIWRDRQNFKKLEPGLFLQRWNIDSNRQICLYYSIRKEPGNRVVSTILTNPCFAKLKKKDGSNISFHQFLQEYTTLLKSKETGLFSLLKTFIWIHYNLLVEANNKIILKLLEKLAVIHGWTQMSSNLEDCLKQLLQNLIKSYEVLELAKEQPAIIPKPTKKLIDTPISVEVGLPVTINGDKYQAILLAPLIPILLQHRQGTFYYSVVELPQDEVEKEYELKEEGLQQLRNMIQLKVYHEIYLKKFSLKEGGEWIRDVKGQKINISQFYSMWHTNIVCQTNCHYFQFRRDYFSHSKQCLQKVFLDILYIAFEQNGDYFFQKTISPRSFRDSSISPCFSYFPYKNLKTYMKGNTNNRTIFKMHILVDSISIEVTGGDLLMALNNAFLMLAVNNVVMSPKLHQSCSAFLYFEYSTLENGGIPSCITFLKEPLQQLFKEFTIDMMRIDPKVLKEEERCASMARTVLPSLETLTNIHKKEYKFDIIGPTQTAQRRLADQIGNINRKRDLTFLQINQGFQYMHVKFVSDKMDSVKFRERTYEFIQFHEHLKMYIPFWLIIQIKQQVIVTKIFVAPFNETADCNHHLMDSRVAEYMKSLLEQANLNYLVSQLNQTNECPYSPYELYFNEDTSSQLKQHKHHNKKPKKRKIENRFMQKLLPVEEDRQPEKSHVRQFKMPLIYEATIPLYERFHEGQGKKNIAEDQFWRTIQIANLQNTYKTPFREDTLIFYFYETPINKDRDRKNEIFKKSKNQLVYQVYSTNTSLKREEIDGTFYQNIINSQQNKLLEVLSEFLTRMSDTISQTELALLTRGQKHTVKLKLPRLSSYGIYLSYLKQILSYVHNKTMRRGAKEEPIRTESFSNSSLTKDESSLFDLTKNNETPGQEYRYLDNDDTLFIFTYQKNQMAASLFPECLYLLQLFLSNSTGRVQELNQNFLKDPAIHKKRKFYILPADNRDPRHTQELAAINARMKPTFNRQTVFPDARKPRDSEEEGMTLQMDINTYGDRPIEKIEQYLLKVSEKALLDYQIELIIGKLKVDLQNQKENLSLVSREKKDLDWNALQAALSDNIDAIVKLDSRTPSRTLTVRRIVRTGWDIEHVLLLKYFKAIVTEISELITQYDKKEKEGEKKETDSLKLRDHQIIYYFVNADGEAIYYGNYWQNEMQELKNMDPLEILRGQLGIIVAQHLTQAIVGRSMHVWLQKMKQCSENQFFSNESYFFKRHFLLRVSLKDKGLDYFSYNVNLKICAKIENFIKALQLWTSERRFLKEFFMNLKDARIFLMSRQSSYAKNKQAEVIKDYEEAKLDSKSTGNLRLTLTQQAKSLISQLTPPRDGLGYYHVMHSDIEKICDTIAQEEVDLSTLPEPSPKYLGSLERMGFQILSVIRNRYLKNQK